MAMRHPRDLDVVRAKLLKDCKRPGFAQSARYLKPIGRGVEGPSIRFAEAAIRAMGNISIESATIYDDYQKRIIRVSARDLESTVTYFSDTAIEKTVERSGFQEGDEVVKTRKNRNGKMVYSIVATEDDLLNKQNAMISKAIRNNGIRLVPADIVEECMEQVIRTMKDSNAQDPEATKRRMFDAFEGIGIPVGEVKLFLGHDAKVLSDQEMMGLRQLFNALKDGDTTWREVMEMRKPKEPEPSTTETVKQQLKSRSQQKREAAQQKPLIPEDGGAA